MSNNALQTIINARLPGKEGLWQIHLLDGKISAIGTPAELKARFGQPDMDHVFTYLAREAKRGE